MVQTAFFVENTGSLSTSCAFKHLKLNNNFISGVYVGK